MYDTGLGATFNVAIDRTAQIRALQYKLQQQKAAPSPWPTVTGPVTTFRPRTPVVVAKPVAVKPPVLIRPTITTTAKPVATVTPVLKLPPTTTSGGGAPLTQGGAPSSGGVEVGTMDSSGGFADTISAFTKSPLPLIIFGVLALALSEKGRK